MVETVTGCLLSFARLVISYINYYFEWLTGFLDFYLPGWRVVVFSPLIIIFFVLPFLLVVYLYVCSLALYVYRKRKPIMDAIHHNDLWEGYRRAVSVFWNGHGSVWHGYEVVGLENIPDKGPALLIYYHGALPIDIYYLISKLYLEKKRTIRNVMDKFAFKIPGLAALFRFWGSFPGPRSEVVRFLKEGEMVSIAPGGVREALFSNNYSLVWKDRLGFAKAAIEANVPILPVFTENCRQAFDIFGSRSKLFQRMYEYTRWPILPMYGGFPVKLTTYIGKPIHCAPGQSAFDLANETKKALQLMIRQYQNPKCGILKGISQRFTSAATSNVTPFTPSATSSSSPRFDDITSTTSLLVRRNAHTDSDDDDDDDMTHI